MAVNNRRAVDKLIRSYESKVVWSNVDSEEALHSAIDAAVPYASNERKADLFARLMDRWADVRSGIQRRMFVQSTIKQWNHDHLFPKEKVNEGKVPQVGNVQARPAVPPRKAR